ncbi:uncharacterized protein LOC107465180 [Arachis duranensis]|uniref:ATP-dependent DNA helicase n=1 Tax=Arachis duranensis TaxID=130453 RepID=A0A6P4BLN5_ARADU|nr:uncharacterized protein LOC107465180 [Arachis duranensis]
MITEQKYVYDQILQAVNSDCGKIFFLYRYGGTEKTFFWNTISTALRSKGQIVLTVASSGIASLLLPGERTAHSRLSMHISEFSATIKSPGLPNHELCFRQGCPVMLIRNIDHSEGLCNSTRLVITWFGNKVIEAEVLSGSNISEKPVFTPGQLYVAVSRVTNKYRLKIVISHDNSNNYTEINNVVYHKVFRNI